MKTLLILLCVLTLTACTPAEPVKTGPPRYSYTELEMVDVDRGTAEVRKLETPVQLMNSEYAENVFATLPRSKQLMKAYESVRAQKPDQIWIALVSFTCLPPLQVIPRFDGERLSLNVLTDPQNELVDCVRVAPLVGIIGVTDNAVAP